MTRARDLSCLRCLGPIQALKSKYGQGYKVDLRLPEEAVLPGGPSAVLAFLQVRSRDPST